MKSYYYVGPEDILELTKSIEKGYLIASISDIETWIKETEQYVDSNSEVIATFVINLGGNLLIADRHSEHVACAGGKNVLSAGEMTFRVENDEVEVVEVTNQSTGYCPEPESWSVIDHALRKIEISHPASLEREFIFRKCINCGGINIVKDQWYVCMECDSDLPCEWNFS